MSRRYRKRYKRYKNNYNEEETTEILPFCIVLLTLNFILMYKEIFLLVGIIIIILCVIFKYKNNIFNFIKNYKKNKYVKKLKKKSILYTSILNLNDKFQFEELGNFYDNYFVRFKSNLETSNIDDYLLMTIDNKYEELKKYKLKYDKLNNKYNEYLKKYEDLNKLITEKEAQKIKMKFDQYKKYQNIILDENKIIKEYIFKVIIYINYRSKKGLVKEKKYKIYDKDLFPKIMEEYFTLKKTNKLYEINSRIERSKMSESLRYNVFKRDGNKCCICGMGSRDGAKLHVDHIIPVSKGGKTEMSNLQTLCSRCNIGKSNKL